MENLKKYLENIAARECWEDAEDIQYGVGDYAGGNIDDAYMGGMESGEVLLARMLLHDYFK